MNQLTFLCPFYGNFLKRMSFFCYFLFLSNKASTSPSEFPLDYILSSLLKTIVLKVFDLFFNVSKIGNLASCFFKTFGIHRI
ncbi:hypothetical protein CDV26_01130 [Francisella halioticida]|uniref:50S rRNA methyltransferase n=1 Tax=Francisella halioticida TaxID=549298 RepID=A0ABN5AWT7_9GAMM|nr:hypothetical protein CDV26_01130 [Francisella halioticida]